MACHVINCHLITPCCLPRVQLQGATAGISINTTPLKLTMPLGDYTSYLDKVEPAEKVPVVLAVTPRVAENVYTSAFNAVSGTNPLWQKSAAALQPLSAAILPLFTAFCHILRPFICVYSEHTLAKRDRRQNLGRISIPSYR